MCGRLLEQNLRSRLTNEHLVLQRFSFWHTKCPDPFNIYESCSVLWKELAMSVLTVLEELQAPKFSWVPSLDFLSVWQPGMQQPCPPGLMPQEGSLDGQATLTSWHPTVKIQDLVKCPSKFGTAPAVGFLVGQQLPCLLAYFPIRTV